MAAAYKNGKLLLGEDSLAFEKIMGYADIVAKEEKYSTDIELPVNLKFFLVNPKNQVTVYRFFDCSHRCKDHPRD